jgi:hypothetical protein
MAPSFFTQMDIAMIKVLHRDGSGWKWCYLIGLYSGVKRKVFSEFCRPPTILWEPCFAGPPIPLLAVRNTIAEAFILSHAALGKGAMNKFGTCFKNGRGSTLPSIDCGKQTVAQLAVLRIRIHRIRIFLGHPDPF